MKYVILTLSVFIHIISFSQPSRYPKEVTPELQKKIKQDVEKEVSNLQQKLLRANKEAVYVEFTLDTFRVERLMAKWVAINYSDFGMKEAGYETARLYDSLMNKYYKKLSAVLKAEDKKALVQAQRAWITFRDSEHNLVTTISKEEYAGGGTMQGLTESSMYMDMIRRRTIELFEHYLRATQIEY